MEIFERIAFYGVRVVVPIYIASSEDPNGLHFDNKQKGIILTVWTLIQTLLPMFTGGFADKYGRKLTIGGSIGIKVAGYLLMATQRTFGGFSSAARCWRWVPPSSNLGSRAPWREASARRIRLWAGHFLSSGEHRRLVRPTAGGISAQAGLEMGIHRLRGHRGGQFPGAADLRRQRGLGGGGREVVGKTMQERSPLDVLWYSVRTMFRPRLLSFILVMSGFWGMMYQIYDSMPTSSRSGSTAETSYRYLAFAKGCWRCRRRAGSWCRRR